MSDAKPLSLFEANLVRLTRCIASAGPTTQLTSILFNVMSRPPCLSRACVDLVSDALAKGCVRRLARAGGWQKGRFLRGNAIAEGRLWERSKSTDLALHFSKQSLELLIWLTCTDLASAKARRQPPPSGKRTAADALLCYDAFSALRETKAAEGLPARFGFAKESLCWLAYPDAFANLAAKPPSFDALVSTDSSPILEAMQHELARRTVEGEQRKRLLTDWRQMQAWGRVVEAVSGTFLEACQRQQRPDLAGFFLAALGELLDESPASTWSPALASLGPRMADRLATQRAALALLRPLERLRQWDADARIVGYFDEGYAAAQLWKSLWDERQGESLSQHADRLLREVGLPTLGQRGDA